ncbi:PREDICTED: prominin-1 [Elephantulus edwardii]|uniref:prominin-1 n=1 Tax=Elephantulus edwardii TaxID=28737 RepID=UPI0003F065D7|nr:PREDICTED: prominin-1 [Elephantulus edwardii]
MARVAGCLLLLGLCGETLTAEPPASTHNDDDLDFVFPAVSYETGGSPSSGPIGALFAMVHTFLHVVQPHAFPEDTIRKIIQNKFDPINNYEEPENVVLTLKVVHYEIGLILCAVLGLLFVVLMPLVGLCFCLCRCCNHCGGELHQRQKKNGPFLKKSFTISLLVICVLMSLGILYGFLANHHIRTHIRTTRRLADSNLRDLRKFLNELPEQMDYLVSQYNTTKDRAVLDLDHIKPLLGGKIHNRLRPKVIPVLDDIKAMTIVITETKDALEVVNQTLDELRNRDARLRTSLDQVRTDLNHSLEDPMCSRPPVSAYCDGIRRSLYQVDSNLGLDQLPSLSNQLDSVKDILKTNVTGLVEQGYKSFNEVPEMVQNQTSGIVSGSKRTFDSIGSTISSVSGQLPVQSTLSSLMFCINESETFINQNFSKLEEYESYRWLACLVVCCLLTLIVIFFYLGMLCGICGYDKQATPTNRGCVSNTGGIFLMTGVGITFLFCWMLMILVVVAFFIGGNVEKLVCEPYENKKLFQVLDTPYLLHDKWRYYLSGLLFQNDSVKLTFESVYSDCKENKGIYTSLQLENHFNISASLNIANYTQDIDKQFGQMNFQLDGLVLLDDVGKQSLKDFSALGLDQLDYSAFLAEMSKTITKGDLEAFAENLSATASLLSQGSLKDSLTVHAQSIRVILQQQVIPLERSMNILSQNIQVLQQTTKGLPVRTTLIIFSLDSTQDFIKHNVSSIISEESEAYARRIIGYFDHYLEWIKDTITKKMAACRPVATALDSAIDVFLCSYIVDPLNLFWFGIGKATVLLLPAVIIAVKLSKYYRRMESEDVYHDVETVPMKNMENGNYGYHKDHLYGLHNPVMTRMSTWA